MTNFTHMLLYNLYVSPDMNPVNPDHRLPAGFASPTDLLLTEALFPSHSTLLKLLLKDCSARTSALCVSRA